MSHTFTLDYSPGTLVIVNRGSLSKPLVRWLRTIPNTIKWSMPTGNQIPRQRNIGVNEMHGEWVCFVDSDTVPLVHTVPQLLSHNAPIVGAVICQRYAPFHVATVKSFEPEQLWDLRDLPSDGLQHVPATGTGCLLVRRYVFEKMKFPWFKCGDLEPDLLQEDISFCLSAAAAGYPTLIDCGMRVGHAIGDGHVIVWPGRDGQVWGQFDGPQDFRIPLVSAHQFVDPA
jgi:cellulose synthase/poly-beta-1,6-N-acetylglucosamine synthase-like glycosyltransferase